MTSRASIEQDIRAALSPLVADGYFVIDAPVSGGSEQLGYAFDKGQISVGWFAEQAPPPRSTNVFSSPLHQTNTLQFEIHLELQDMHHAKAAEAVDKIEELVLGLSPKDTRSALYLVRAGYLRLDEDSIWHYAVIVGIDINQQYKIKEAA
jgi:hypothetical protein